MIYGRKLHEKYIHGRSCKTMATYLTIPRSSSFALSTISSREELVASDASDRGVDDAADRDSVFTSASSTMADGQDARVIDAVDDENATPSTTRHQPLRRQQGVIVNSGMSQVSDDGPQHLTAHLPASAETSQVRQPIQTENTHTSASAGADVFCCRSTLYTWS